MKKFILMFVILNTLIIADNNFKNPDGRPFLLTIQTNLYDGRYSYRSWNEDYYDYDDVESFNYKVLDRCNGECSKKMYFSWKMPVSKHVTLSGYYNKSIYP